uniref:Uncharacterized protein n=1 Tax=Manihot esculenta TaxID=3983 RepID=A0A2C9V1W8_MANES
MLIAEYRAIYEAEGIESGAFSVQTTTSSLLLASFLLIAEMIYRSENISDHP